VDALDRHQPSTVAFDANLTPEVMSEILQECQRREIPVVHDPTSLPKMLRILPGIEKHRPTALGRPLITHYTPNNLELKNLYEALRNKGLLETDHWWSFIDALQLDSNWRNSVERLTKRSGQQWIGQEGVAQMMVSLLPWVGNLWLKCGDKGVLYLGIQADQETASPISTATGRISTKAFHALPPVAGQSSRKLVMAHYAANSLPSVVSTTGAGDSFVGGLLSQILSSQDWTTSVAQVVDTAMACAEKSLVSERAVGDVEALK
jgi:pseudouridine-5'-phosphate glycosidase/pseudouridine kinase